MTTRQSTTLHMSGDGDDPNNGLAFSTIDAGDPEAGAPGELRQVLEVWGTIEAPDGQLLTARMKVGMPDVRDLQAFLSDHFGRGVRKLPESVRDIVETAIRNLIEQGYGIVAPDGSEYGSGGLSPARMEPYPDNEDDLPMDAGGHVNDLAFYDVPNDPWQPKPGDTVHVITAQVTGAAPRQCAVIYNDVQCLAPEGHAQQHDFGPIAQHQPDVDLFQEQAAAIQRADDNHTPQDLSDNPRSAQHTDNQAPRFVLGPKNAAEQARKRRLKLEIEFDDLAEKYKTDPHNPGAVAALNDAAVALHKREPDNSRVVNFLFDPTSAVHPATGLPEQPEQPEQLPEAHFAPEPANPPPTPYEPSLFPGTDPTQMTAAQQAWTNNPDGSASFSPIAAEQSAAQAFPCPHQSSDQRPCLRPAGHEIELPNRPAVPHVYATTPSMLNQQPATVAPGPNGPHVTYQPPAQPQPDAGFAQPPAPYAAPAQPVQPFQQPHLQAVPDPQPNVAVMSFHENEPGMPAAPAMPTWQAPQQ